MSVQKVCVVYRSGGPEDMCLLERCPHFRGCIYSVYIQCVQELGPEDVSLYIREVSSFQMVYIIYRLRAYWWHSGL